MDARPTLAPPARRAQRLTGTDLVISFFLPYINFLVVALYLARPQSRRRGLRMLIASAIASAGWGAAMLLLMSGVMIDFQFPETCSGFLERCFQSENRLYTIGWLIVVLGIPFLVVRSVKSRRLARAWIELSESTGLEFKPGGWFMVGTSPRVAGDYGGRRLELYCYMSQQDSDTSDYTHLALDVQNPTDASFRLEHAPIVRAIDRLFRRGAETSFADEEFHEVFTVHSDPSDFAPTLLAESELEYHLLHLRENTEIELRGNRLSLERIGLEKDVEYLRFCLDLLSELADAVEHVGEGLSRRGETSGIGFSMGPS